MQLTSENYYSQEANQEYMSVSGYKDFAGTYGKMPCEFYGMEKLNGRWEDEKSTALLVGSYVDSYFEGSLEQFKKDNPEIFTQKGELKANFKQAEEIIARIERDEYFMKYMSGQKQVIMTGELFGAKWKIKMDSYIPGVAIVDLKVMAYMVQEFDNELVFMGELWSGCKYPDEVLDWMKSNYEIESCLTAEVYRSSLGDCTNNGISSYARELYILDAQKGPFEPDDIRQCVYIEKREIMGQEYVDCKPAYCRKRWYMAGGNILYTSDSRFKQITGISYPIAIHDRYEGR